MFIYNIRGTGTALFSSTDQHVAQYHGCGKIGFHKRDENVLSCMLQAVHTYYQYNGFY